MGGTGWVVQWVVHSGLYRLGDTECVVQSAWYRVGGTYYRVGSTAWYSVSGA